VRTEIETLGFGSDFRVPATPTVEILAHN